MKRLVFVLFFCLVMVIGISFAADETVFLKGVTDYELFYNNGKVAILSYVDSDKAIMNETINNNSLIKRYQVYLPIYIQIDKDEEIARAYLVRSGNDIATEKELIISNLDDKYEVAIEQIIGFPDGVGMTAETLFQEKRVYKYRINWTTRGYTKKTTDLDIVVIRDKDAAEFDNIYLNIINKNYTSIYSKIMSMPNGDLNVLENYLTAKYAVDWDVDTKILQEMRELNMAKIEFLDLDSNHWAYNVIKSMAVKGVLAGYEDGTFRAENYLTRAEAAQIISKYFDLPAMNEDYIFDVAKEHWAYEAIKRAGAYIPMVNSNFDAETNITRKDFIIAIMKWKNVDNGAKENFFTDLNGFSDDEIHMINQAYAFGIINGYGDGTFRPNEPLTRAEACAILARSK